MAISVRTIAEQDDQRQQARTADRSAADQTDNKRAEYGADSLPRRGGRSVYFRSICSCHGYIPRLHASMRRHRHATSLLHSDEDGGEKAEIISSRGARNPIAGDRRTTPAGRLVTGGLEEETKLDIV